MIHYLVTDAGDHTFRDSAILDDDRLRGRFEVVPYRTAFERNEWRGGTVVFADVDRLGYGEAMRAALLYLNMRAAEGPLRLLNHPTRTCRRYALLRRLRNIGLNEHDAYRIDEFRKPERWPVFIRRESHHDGSLTPLLYDHAAVQQETVRLIARGFLPQDLLIVEFCDTAGPDSVYRKYTAFVAGDRLFQRFVFFSDDWQVKEPRGGTVAETFSEAEMLREEREFLDDDRFVPLLREVAREAAVGFGRIDFGIKDGRPQIWEINTNPDPAVNAFATGTGRADYIQPTGWAKLRDAIAALDDDAAHETVVTVDPPPRSDDWYRVFRDRVRRRSGALEPDADPGSDEDSGADSVGDPDASPDDGPANPAAPERFTG